MVGPVRDNPMNKEVIDVVVDLAEVLARKHLTIFCGAGISRNSGVPPVKPLLAHLLGKLSIPESIHRKFWDIPFEMVMQTLIEHSRGVEDGIFDIYGLGRPNTSHLFLAALMHSDKVRTIVTTNFDHLIEHALHVDPPAMVTSSRGPTPGGLDMAEYRLLYRDDHFEACRLDDGQKRLVKIHGSYQDKASMIITIKQIAQRDLSANRRNLVKRVFANTMAEEHAVLVLGYSCSDLFDINECIASVTGDKKRIYFVQYSTTEERVEDISILKDKNPFSHYPGKRIYCDTDAFIEELWKKAVLLPYRRVCCAGDEHWKTMIDRWAGWNSDYNKDDILGKLYFDVREYQRSIQHYQAVLTSCRLKNDRLNVAECLHNIGLAYHGNEDSSTAIEYYEQALRAAKQHRDKELAMVLYGSLAAAGMKLYFLGDKECERSLRYYKKALRTAKRLKDKRHEGHWRNGIASVYMHRKLDSLAISHLQRALDIARELGDKRSECSRLVSMGTLHYHLGNYEEAIGFYEQALYIAKGLGDIPTEVQLLDDIERSNKMKDAPDRFEKSMQRMGIEILDESQISVSDAFWSQIIGFIGVIITFFIVWMLLQRFC